MAAQTPYTVKFPDGHVQKFQGPKDMSDTDVFARAMQERSIAEGKVQTSWLGGALKQMGQEKAANAALIGGAGMLTGVAPVVALAPLAATWIDYATKKLTGEKPETPSAVEQVLDVAGGMAGAYGGKLLSKSAGIVTDELGKMRGTTLPQAMGKIVARSAEPVATEASKVSPQAVGATTKEMVMAGKTALDRTRYGVSADDLRLMRDNVSAGIKPTVSAKMIAGKDQKKFMGLMNLYRRPAAGLAP